MLKEPAENERKRKLWGEREGKQSWVHCWGGVGGLGAVGAWRVRSALREGGALRQSCVGRLSGRCPSLFQGAPPPTGNEPAVRQEDTLEFS